MSAASIADAPGQLRIAEAAMSAPKKAMESP
jgi:hypothetical protein